MTSVVHVARNIRAHRPDLIVGDGQGAMIALGLACPLVLEAALSQRAVDIKEAVQIARAWGHVKGILVREPRVGKNRLDLTELRQAVPELFIKDHPWSGPPCIAVAERTDPKRDEQKALLTECGACHCSSIADVMIRELLATPERLIWDHHGKCHCGRKSYLFG